MDPQISLHSHLLELKRPCVPYFLEMSLLPPFQMGSQNECFRRHIGGGKGERII